MEPIAILGIIAVVIITLTPAFIDREWGLDLTLIFGMMAFIAIPIIVIGTTV